MEGVASSRGCSDFVINFMMLTVIMLLSIYRILEVLLSNTLLR